MAKLLVNPEDEMVVDYMNDQRSPKEHYHFATVNWARYVPLFRSTITDITWSTYLKADPPTPITSMVAEPKTIKPCNIRVRW